MEDEKIRDSRIYNLTKEEFKYLEKKIPNSAVLMSQTPLRFQIDPLDLTAYKYGQGGVDKQEQYCKKAVELKQWDHIYYLTQVNSTMHIISCLDPSPKYAHFSSPCCREAMKLAVKGWSKEDLYDVVNIDISADGIPEEYYEEVKRDIRNAILKATGRDLDKEP